MWWGGKWLVRGGVTTWGPRHEPWAPRVAGDGDCTLAVEWGGGGGGGGTAAVDGDMAKWAESMWFMAGELAARAMGLPGNPVNAWGKPVKAVIEAKLTVPPRAWANVGDI